MSGESGGWLDPAGPDLGPDPEWFAELGEEYEPGLPEAS